MLLPTVGACSDKTQLQAFVLPVKPLQFPHGETATCPGGKKVDCVYVRRVTIETGMNEAPWLKSFISERHGSPLCGAFLLFDPKVWPQGDVTENGQLRHVRSELAASKTLCSQRGVNSGIHYVKWRSGHLLWPLTKLDLCAWEWACTNFWTHYETEKKMFFSPIKKLQSFILHPKFTFVQKEMHLLQNLDLFFKFKVSGFA